MAFTSIQKKKLYEEIIAQIIQYIETEQLKPGDKLPSENELTELFQVSKTALREALSVLAAKGMLEKRPGVGSILKEVTASALVEQITTKWIVGTQTLREVLEFRRGIEVEAAALAAARASAEQLEAIESAHLELIETNFQGGIGIEEDYRFHSLIILSCGNAMYEKTFHSISPMFFESMAISKVQSLEVSRRYFTESHEEHHRILMALRQQNPDEARAAMLDHLQKNESKIWSHQLHI